MKEFKFRLWEGELEAMITDENSDQFLIALDGRVFDTGFTFSHQASHCNDMTVLQYTGLKDKNGVEIYEGDIVIQHCEWSGGYNSDDFGESETVGVVKIYPSKGVVLTRAKGRDLIECETEWSKRFDLNVRSYRAKVIGNIYENPELIGDI